MHGASPRANEPMSASANPVLPSTMRARYVAGRRAPSWHALGPVALLLATALASAAEPAALRQQQLVRLVRQDCGSCHGLQLTGGLGPALTATALREWPTESLVATILHGRPGTPMPPWKSFLTEDEATWIARKLRDGFPHESRNTP